MGRISTVPSFSLSQCFEDVTKLYAQYSHASFRKAEIANALGFSASSGPFGTRVASLKLFGLVQTDGQGYRITDEFKKMRIADRGSVEFKTLALELLRRPALFSEILDEFKHKIPSKNTLAQSPQKAGPVAALFIESLRFAGALDENNNVLPPRDERGPDDKRQGDQKKDPPRQELQGVIAGTLLSIDIALGGEKVAKVLYPPELTKAQAQKISNVLNALAN